MPSLTPAPMPRRALLALGFLIACNREPAGPAPAKPEVYSLVAAEANPLPRYIWDRGTDLNVELSLAKLTLVPPSRATLVMWTRARPMVHDGNFAPWGPLLIDTIPGRYDRTATAISVSFGGGYIGGKVEGRSLFLDTNYGYLQFSRD